MLQFKDIANSREFKRKSLLKISAKHDNFFENAIEENIKSLKEKIIITEGKFEELNNKIYDNDISIFTSEEKSC